MMRLLLLIVFCMLTLCTYSQGAYCSDPLGTSGITNLPPVTVEASNAFSAIILLAFKMDRFEPGLKCAGCPDGQEGCEPSLEVDWSFNKMTMNADGDFVFTGIVVEWTLMCSGCTDKAQSFDPNRLSSNDLKELSTVNAFPNPVKDVLYIGFGGLEMSDFSGHQLEIFDMSGQLLLTCTDCKEVDVSSLPAGIHGLRLRFADGQFSTTRFQKVN